MAVDWLRSISERLAGLFYRLGPGDFVIRYRPGHPVAVRGRIPRGKVAAIHAFLARDLNLPAATTVRGSSSGGSLRLKFSGVLSAADRQRIRNYLIEHLG